jgi:hypothetical protein
MVTRIAARRGAAGATGATVLLLCLALLAGCAERGPQARFDDYLQRLARALEVEPAATDEAAAMPVPPRSTQLQVTHDRDRIDGLDFLALSDCALQVTVGKRNSSLGRLARPSQRLLLELEFLRLAPPCITTLRSREREELARLIEDAAARKRQQLPARIFNATLGSEEYRALCQAPHRLGDYPAQTSSIVPHALAAITADTQRWLAGDYRADGRALELALGDVARGDGGALLQALQLQSIALAGADRLTLARTARGPLCAPQYRPQAATVTRNVMTRFFIGGIQPWSADLARRYHQLLPPIQALEQLLDGALPAAYREWQRERSTLLQHAMDSPARHVEHLQRLLSPCGVLPQP